MESSTLRNNGPDDRSPRGRVRIPVRPESVVRARALVRERATVAGLSADRVDDLVIAVSEACTNAIEAQARARVTVPVEVRCRRRGRTFEVVVRDHGAGFDPAAVPVRPPPADPRHLDVERGWGIELMRELVDDLSFDVSSAGVTVHLRMTVR